MALQILQTPDTGQALLEGDLAHGNRDAGGDLPDVPTTEYTEYTEDRFRHSMYSYVSVFIRVFRGSQFRLVEAIAQEREWIM
jgi:hypothetical protein